MQILVINAGSTSLKYKLFAAENFKTIRENNFQNISSHTQALKMTFREIGDLREVSVIGHRVVHGGNDFTEPVLIKPNVLAQLEASAHLAPLHNPANILGIKAAWEYLPHIPNVACFDTAFYQTLPDRAKIYAIPWEFYLQGIQRFGFHGLSHKYVAGVAAEKLNRPLHKINLISCHLGGGCSITAIKKGEAIDTSMGFTPLEGLMMMTRCGDLDPGVIIEILRTRQGPGEAIAELDNLLNKESGFRGLCGLDDYLQILKEVTLGNNKAKLALEIFTYRLIKYIGAYYAALGGKVDAVIFTGNIGAGNPLTRKKVIKEADFLKGIEVLNIPTNEELQIAKEVSKVLA